MPHRGRRIDPQVSDGWFKFIKCELMDVVKLVVNVLNFCLAKLVKNELMYCLTKLLGKMMLRDLRKDG